MDRSDVLLLVGTAVCGVGLWLLAPWLSLVVVGVGLAVAGVVDGWSVEAQAGDDGDAAEDAA